MTRTDLDKPAPTDGLADSRRLGLLSSWSLGALACVLILGAVLALIWPWAPAANHITRAQLLAYDVDAYTLPSRHVDPDRLPGQWRAVELPYQPLPRFLTNPKAPVPEANHLTTTWYRLAAPPPQALRSPLYLYIPRWKTDGQIAIYVDGRLTYQSHANPQWNGSNKPLWVALEETTEARTPREILIRLQHVRGIGGSLSSVWLATYDDIVWSYMTRGFFVVTLPYMSSVAFLAMGVFTLFIWLSGRRDPVYLLFFLMSVAAIIRTLQTYVGADRLPVSDALFGWATTNALFWALMITHLFLGQVHRHPQPRLTSVIAAVVIACALVTFPAATLLDPTLAAPLIYVAMIVIGNVVCLNGLWRSWRAGEPEGVWLASGGMVGVLCGVYDWLLQNNLVNIEGLFLSFYVNIAIILAFAAIMLRRYVTAIAKAELASRDIAFQLSRREAELAESYAKLRAVERRETLARERERMMQDMHDGMGSSLVTALRAAEHGKLGEREIVELLKDCIDDLKLTIDSMEPVETDLLLLVATFRFRLQPRLESAGIRLVWRVGEVPPLDWLDQRSCLHILRILQEGVTNIIKHASASTIVMSTQGDGDHVAITIVDDGAGFDVGAASLSSGGKGMANQMRRAEAIGARIDWLSGPEGTSLRLVLPVIRPLRGR